MPYSQQWNFTLEHQFTPNFYISTAYVGNKGTRLASAINPLNVLSPSTFAMGSQLNDQFTPNSGMTQLDGVNIPYAGWIEQMKACKPTVGQAMLPFPQFCGRVMGLNENLGTSAYHGLQLKAEKRFSQGFWFLTSYTWSKLMTTSDSMQSWLEPRGINPAFRSRNWALSTGDSPHQLALSTMYQLPFGKGKPFANTGGVANVLVGGWQITSIFRYGSGMPLSFTAGSCNIPGLLYSTCYPAITGSLFTTDMGSFDPNLAAGNTAKLFDSTAFETTGLVNGEWYPGAGSRVSNVRGFSYTNQDFGILKETGITERVKFIFRADVFNMWNLHSFQNSIDTNVSSANFGQWGGGVTAPRNIQLSGHLRF